MFAGADRDTLQYIIYAADRRSLPVNKRVPTSKERLAQNEESLVRVSSRHCYSTRVRMIDRHSRRIPGADFRKFYAVTDQFRLIDQSRLSRIEYSPVRHASRLYDVRHFGACDRHNSLHEPGA